MEKKKINDGTGLGLMNNEGLIDSLIMDCNNSVKEIACGQYIAWCNIMVQIVQKLANLKIGVRNDTESLKKQVEDQQRIIKMLEEQTERQAVKPDSGSAK